MHTCSIYRAHARRSQSQSSLALPYPLGLRLGAYQLEIISSTQHLQSGNAKLVSVYIDQFGMQLRRLAS